MLNDPAPVDLPLKSCPVFFMTSRMLCFWANLRAAEIWSELEMLTEYSAVPASVHGVEALSEGKHAKSWKYGD